MQNQLATLAAMLQSVQFVRQCATLAGKLQKLLLAVDKNEHNRAIRLAKRLCERCIKDALFIIQNGKDARIWTVLKNRGCEFLPDGNQDRVIRALIAVFSDVPRPRLPRSAVTDRVLAQLNRQGFATVHTACWSAPSWPTTTLTPTPTPTYRFSKTKVGHVLHLLSHGDAFAMSSEQLATPTSWQLREELLDFEQLRRVNDGTIVAMAQDEGLFLSPSGWARHLYRDGSKTAYFQSILDCHKVELPKLLDLLRKLNLDAFSRPGLLDTLSQLSAMPNGREHDATPQQVASALLAVHDTLHVLLDARDSAQLSSPSSSVSSSTLDEQSRVWLGNCEQSRSRAASSVGSPVVRPWHLGPIGTRPVTPAGGALFQFQCRPVGADERQRRLSSCSSTESNSVFQFAPATGSLPVSPAALACDLLATPARPIRGRGRGRGAASSDSFTEELHSLSLQLCDWQPLETPTTPDYQKHFVLRAFEPCSQLEVANSVSVSVSSAGKVRKSRRSSSACDLTATSEYDELGLADDVFPSSYFTLNCVPNSSLLLDPDQSPLSPQSGVAHTARPMPLYLRTLSEAAKDDLSH